MPSPFPGMDPFIEGQRWQDFHTTYIALLKELLVPAVRPKYSVDVEQKEGRRQKYLTIRDREDRKVVTVIELLSPTNKSPGDGYMEYQGKRENILNTRTNLVELDLLRGGKRLPTRERLPAADYYAFICRSNRYPNVDVYAWTLRQPLPRIAVPLAAGEKEISLDLQDALTKTYDRSGYDYALDYRRLADPPPDGELAEWAGKHLPVH